MQILFLQTTGDDDDDDVDDDDDDDDDDVVQSKAPTGRILNSMNTIFQSFFFF